MTIYEPDDLPEMSKWTPAPDPPSTVPPVREKLPSRSNYESMENGSGTPDFILAQYLEGCLKNFDETLAAREKWDGRDTEGNDIRETTTEPLGPNPGGYNPR